MACGCSKKGMRNTTRRLSNSPRRVVTAASTRPAPTNDVQAQSTGEVTAQGVSGRSPSGLSAERRLVEKRRREAIRNALGKG